MSYARISDPHDHDDSFDPNTDGAHRPRQSALNRPSQQPYTDPFSDSAHPPPALEQRMPTSASRFPNIRMGPFARFADKRGAGRQIRPTDRKRQLKLLRSYAPDWILTIILAAAFFALDKTDGYRRVFSLDDTSLRHPYTVHERIPNKELFLIAVVAPFVLQIFINLATIRSWWDFHNGSLGLILGLALTGAVTQFVKLTVGRPRPDVIARCVPRPGSADPQWGLSDSSICTQTDIYMLRDGFRSFPSGHSSLSFAGLGFLSYYLAGKLHLFDKRGHAGKAWLALAPFSGAALTAISRTMDYRHHWQDVLVGSILGTVLAYFSYRQYYPTLESDLSHRPYSPRIHRDNDDEGNVDHDGGNGTYLPTHHRAETLGSGTELGLNPPVVAAGRYDAPMGNAGYRENIEISEVSHNVPGTVERPGPAYMTETWKEGGERV